MRPWMQGFVARSSITLQEETSIWLRSQPSYVFLQTEILDAPMVLMSILAAIGTFPMQRIYKCTACKFATAETVKTP